ncbi:hypothetical protein D3OALGB2SA_2481 [Olavius algarvensis associated proteobacterium Delta 3]|nr:hypothetical protein D3OALGB2SA_2481 [Olavius algarvensis associated proteobacterium Delta 3]
MTATNGKSFDGVAFLTETFGKNASAMCQLINASQNYIVGLSKYTGDFLMPYLISTGYFTKVESGKLLTSTPLDSMLSYLKLQDFNIDLLNRAFFSGLRSINSYGQMEMGALIAALGSASSNENGEPWAAFARRQAYLMDLVANAYPKAIQAIEPEYGFHFEKGEHTLAGETDRFCSIK